MTTELERLVIRHKIFNEEGRFMGFDAIPEDKQESFPCEECGKGNIVKNKDGDWECDTCPAIYEGS